MRTQAFPDDGNDGIDNALGESLLPIFAGFSTGFEQDTNDRLAAGAPSLLVTVDDLGAANTASPLVAHITLCGLDPSFCDPESPTVQSLATQLQGAAAISVGIGFDASQVVVDGVGAEVVLPPDPCEP
jgi:hypothetical protein